jgi:transcriptional regulatory protein RtcR
MKKKTVVLGFLGTTLDKGVTDARWNRWRPTISLLGHEDTFQVDRLELFLSNENAVDLARHIADDVGTISPSTDVFAHNLDTPDPWDFAAVYAALHEFARNYEFQDDCDYYVHLTTGTHIAQICLFLLTESRHFPAKLVDTGINKKAQTDLWRGQLDIIDLDLSTYDLLSSRFSKEQADSESLLKGGIETRNHRFNELISEIEKVAQRSSASILLMGPTGAGKTMLGQRIYELRSRRHLVKGTFVEVNCATLRGENAMSALFGHKKGAFTGAVSDRAGLLKSGDKGIVFLDEIGELGLEEQAMLLRALEDKRFMPLGSDKEVDSDFQLIAGTNRDLGDEVAAGRFRADLYARINVWSFTIPSLAERVEDLEPNVEYELERVSALLHCKVSFNQDARKRYLEFGRQAPWPGNFRDLASSIMRMATLADGGRILGPDVAREIARCEASWKVSGSAQQGVQTAGQASSMHPGALQLSQYFIEEPVDAFDAAQIDTVLTAIAKTGSMAEAGRLLFAVSRAKRTTTNDTMRVKNFLKQWGLSYQDVKTRLAQLAT